MGNHTVHLPKSRYGRLICPFSALIAALFGTKGKIMRTGDYACPKTLLATVDATLAELIILPPAICAQEEGPFQPPFFASAHRSPRSGGFLFGTAFSGGL